MLRVNVGRTILILLNVGCILIGLAQPELKISMRYIDDTVIFIENNHKINHVLRVANSVNFHIEFTFELEDYKTLKLSFFLCS